MHFDEIRQFEWILRLKMSKSCIENKNFRTILVLNTIFRLPCAERIRSIKITQTNDKLFFYFRTLVFSSFAPLKYSL